MTERPALIKGSRDLYPLRQSATQPRQPVIIVKTQGRTDRGEYYASIASVPSRKAGIARSLAHMFGDEMPGVATVTITEGGAATDVYTRLDDDTVVHDNRLADRIYLLNDSNMDVGLE